ncbi:MAG: hypothetical protein HZB38_05050, partial [Planctomycetes bacterium]|nr:hypothetical protein [Planctomycetota bacterium]
MSDFLKLVTTPPLSVLLVPTLILAAVFLYRRLGLTRRRASREYTEAEEMRRVVSELVAELESVTQRCEERIARQVDRLSEIERRIDQQPQAIESDPPAVATRPVPADERSTAPITPVVGFSPAPPPIVNILNRPTRRERFGLANPTIDAATAPSSFPPVRTAPASEVRSLADAGRS